MEKFYQWLACEMTILASVSDPDQDPCGWLPWILIRIRNNDPGPDPGKSKWHPNKGKDSGISSWKEHWPFNESLMIFTWAWESLLKVSKAICDEKSYKKYAEIFVFHFCSVSFLYWKPGLESWSGSRILIQIQIRFNLKCWIRIRICNAASTQTIAGFFLFSYFPWKFIKFLSSCWLWP